MSRKPTLGTVAKEAGVSIPTVSQVLRGTGRISESTRDKVLRAAKKLHYVPDFRAAAMRSGENREIGFVINQLSNPFNAEVVSGVVDLLETEGYMVSILDTRDDAQRQTSQLEAVIKHGRGGLLWVPAFDTPTETFDLLAAHKMPTVTFLRQVNETFDHVGIRNAEATRKATEYLADLGHRHIAYLGGTDMTIVRSERIEGYKRAVSERALGPCILWDSMDNKLAGLEAMQALLRAHPEVTAVVCNGDMVAIGACLALSRSGQRPGGDVSVIGFDNIQDAAVSTPALTTMGVSPNKLGQILAQVILRRIHNPEMPLTVSEISAELIVRESTGAPSPR
ncbi:LacI family DNA-binding transcriptional regulator [Celeribacter arenosi]|uniref:LacI family DNA-binding transcriptional regulator n=1 Tax=Celeribacter arenosi TaxID=792649 RepID=A0ABP7K8Z1_9RHOB